MSVRSSRRSQVDETLFASVRWCGCAECFSSMCMHAHFAWTSEFERAPGAACHLTCLFACLTDRAGQNPVSRRSTLGSAGVVISQSELARIKVQHKLASAPRYVRLS